MKKIFVSVVVLSLLVVQAISMNTEAPQSKALPWSSLQVEQASALSSFDQVDNLSLEKLSTDLTLDRAGSDLTLSAEDSRSQLDLSSNLDLKAGTSQGNKNSQDLALSNSAKKSIETTAAKQRIFNLLNTQPNPVDVSVGNIRGAVAVNQNPQRLLEMPKDIVSELISIEMAEGEHPQNELPGDLNGDGVVNFGDFQILQVNFGDSPATFEDGDINGDGVVDFTDFQILQSNFGQESSIHEG